MNALAQKYLTTIEGFIPDLNDCLEDNNDVNGLRDAVYDFACDYIYDRERDNTVESIREAATQIAAHYCGEKEDDDDNSEATD